MPSASPMLPELTLFSTLIELNEPETVRGCWGATCWDVPSCPTASAGLDAALDGNDCCCAGSGSNSSDAIDSGEEERAGNNLGGA